MVVNPEESKAASLLLPFPAGIRWARTTEAGAGAGMREVTAGTASSRWGRIQPLREATAGGEQPALPPV